MPLMQLRMLVLPAPFGPMIAKKSPVSTARLTPASAVTPPKFRCTSSRVSTAILLSSLLPAMGRLPRRAGGASGYHASVRKARRTSEAVELETQRETHRHTVVRRAVGQPFRHRTGE